MTLHLSSHDKQKMETRSSSEGSLASSAADDVEGKSSEVLLEELSGDYSRFLNFNVAKEQSKFSESVETMLTKLEEFCGLVDMIRSDTTLCLSKTMPEIMSKCEEMQDMFDRIERLEAFVSVVKKDVIAMEECVNQAENDLTSGNFIKRLSSFVSSKKTAVSTQKRQFTPPHIYSTEQYLGVSTPSHSAQSVETNSTTTAPAEEAEPAVESETT